MNEGYRAYCEFFLELQKGLYEELCYLIIIYAICFKGFVIALLLVILMIISFIQIAAIYTQQINKCKALATCFNGLEVVK